MSEPPAAASETAKTAPQRLPARALALLAVVVLLWGAAYPAMKIAALEIPMFTFRGLAAVGPGLVLLVMARMSGHALAVPRGSRMALFLAGFFTTTITHMLTNVSTLYVVSGQTAIILYTMPIWVFIIGIPVLGERPTRGHWAGLVLGIGGIVLLWLQTAPAGGMSMGVLVGLVAAVSWACGTIAAKGVVERVPPMVMTGWMFTVGGLPLCLIGLTEIDRLAPLSAAAVWSALFIAVGTNFIGFLAFYHIVRQVPATVASLSVLAVPGVAFAAGAVLLDEAITPVDVIAFALIAAALATVLPKPSIRRRPPKTDA